ncbi:MAG: hypothetical protein V1822_03355 [Candidatus Micrarchaeota archaeon]
MQTDLFSIYEIAGAIAILCALVYLMYKEGSASSWKEISKNAKEKIRAR